VTVIFSAGAGSFFYREGAMEQFLNKLSDGPRIIAVTGHFGSGKTEFAVSLAFALAKEKANLALCDLDIENPYFRSRERGTLLEQAGIRVYSDPYNGRNGSELQTISAAIRAPLEDERCTAILDCGGDHSGAMVMNQFAKYFAPGAFQLLCVVNPSRPGTDTVEKAVNHLKAIEEVTGLRVTGLIANNHMIRYTTPGDVYEGWAFTKQVEAITGVPALAACAMESIAGEIEGIPLFPVGLYMRESYLDKEV